jgi:hypothetical protein
MISPKYPHTVELLRNYIHNRLVKVFDEPKEFHSKHMFANKHRYMPSTLEIEKGREIYNEKISI